MNIKNLRISVQLKIGFAVLLLFVVVLAVVFDKKIGKINRQSEIMFMHPLKVKAAIGDLESDIMCMRYSTRDLMLAVNNQEKRAAIQQMELSYADALRQFNILEEYYLGPKKDIEEAYKAFISWKIAHDENIKLALSGEIEKVKESVSSTGAAGRYREQMLAEIKHVDDFAGNKAEELYKHSNELKDSAHTQLVLFVATILIFSLIIIYTVLRNIRHPLAELIDASKRFHAGDMRARSSYAFHNEFGVLSDSFNDMAEGIQEKTDLDGKVANLAGLMLSEYDVKMFFRSTLNALAASTGSQMAAIYLLSDDKKTFEHFESTGVDDNARQSFSAESFEGEFGSVISSRKIQLIKNIPEDTRFVFHTVSGKFIPREIITIPILANQEVVAIISLASVGIYGNQSIQLIERILVTMCARVEGILAYHKIKEFSGKLEGQNSELQEQKKEMASQSAELIEQNRELEMQKKQLGEANRLKTNFLSTMSHELRTPLNSVIALAGVLHRRLEKQIPEEEYGFLEVIERNGKHLLDLINDVLDISRIESGREEIEITKFDAKRLIVEVIDMIGPQAKLKNIELLQTGSDSELSISSDSGKCRHIMQNIIGNAVKFTDKGKVEVSARQRGGNIEITVADTGIGIDAQHISHIFDEFRQADSSTSRRFGGTGLGLAIAKKYADLLGGTVTAKSVPGKGSEFTITLPLEYTERRQLGGIGKHAAGREEEESAGKGAGGPAGGTPTERRHLGGIGSWKDKDCQQVAGGPLRNAGSTKTVLLVDDSEPVIVQIKDILEESGYEILVARDGAEALGIIAQTIPDAMILDLMMPVVDGFSVLKSLREAEQTAAVPVLILTAKHISKEDLSFLTRNNIHQLIQKGDVNRNELLKAVGQMVISETTEKAKRELQRIDGKPLVLVAEDNPDNMLTVKALLSAKYSVIEAVNGKICVEMAKSRLPNLILMDIALPGMDGIEAFRAIRKDGSLQHIPVVALTASAMTSDRETILSHGFDAYIAKPIDDKLFFKTINEVLYGK